MPVLHTKINVNKNVRINFNTLVLKLVILLAAIVEVVEFNVYLSSFYVKVF